MYTIPMSTKSGGYKINEKDIDSVLNFLKRKHPQNATPEMAIKILAHFKAKFHEMAHTDPQTLDQILEDLKKKS